MLRRALFGAPVRRISSSGVLPAIKTVIKKPVKVQDDVILPVETDTEKLANYLCGSNLFIEGGEDVKLKPDSEYPAWLWKMEPVRPLNELSENSRYYWKEVQREGWRQQKYLNSLFRNSKVRK